MLNTNYKKSLDFHTMPVVNQSWEKALVISPSGLIPRILLYLGAP